MKYLYIRLNEFEIITFKSVLCRVAGDKIQVCFNGAEGLFKTVKTTDEAKKIVDDIMLYLQQDGAVYRAIDLSDYGLKEIM